jgi:hypothetical protein
MKFIFKGGNPMGKIKQFTILALLVGGMLLAGGISYAQTGSGYDLSWGTVDGGGDTATGGGYSLSGTAGQPDTGTTMTGGGYSLAGGFWNSSSLGGNEKVYLPIVIKN